MSFYLVQLYSNICVRRQSELLSITAMVDYETEPEEPEESEEPEPEPEIKAAAVAEAATAAESSELAVGNKRNRLRPSLLARAMLGSLLTTAVTQLASVGGAATAFATEPYTVPTAAGGSDGDNSIDITVRSTARLLGALQQLLADTRKRAHGRDAGGVARASCSRSERGSQASIIPRTAMSSTQTDPDVGGYESGLRRDERERAVATRAHTECFALQQKEHQTYSSVLQRLAASIRPLRAKNAKLAAGLQIVWEVARHRGLLLAAGAMPPLQHDLKPLSLPTSFGSIVDTSAIEQQLRTALLAAHQAKIKQRDRGSQPSHGVRDSVDRELAAEELPTVKDETEQQRDGGSQPSHGVRDNVDRELAAEELRTMIDDLKQLTLDSLNLEQVNRSMHGDRI